MLIHRVGEISAFPFETFEELQAAVAIRSFNIGVDACDRWAAQDPRKLAIVAVQPNGRAQLAEAYVYIRKAEAFLIGAHLSLSKRAVLQLRGEAGGMI